MVRPYAIARVARNEQQLHTVGMHFGLVSHTFCVPPSKHNLLLRSLKAIRKEAAVVAMILGRTSPEPWVGSSVELSCRNAGGLLKLIGIGKALPRKGITTEEAPPALLQVEPAGSFGNEEVVNAGVLGQPSAGLSAVMEASIISNDEDVPGRIVGFNVGQRGNIALGVARSGTPGQHLAIAHP